MCYAIPAKLVEIKEDQKIGVIDYFGEQRKVLLDLDDLKVGDYVYAQGGVLIRKIPEKEAREILASWQKVFFEFSFIMTLHNSWSIFIIDLCVVKP